jgi:hypothetical protein
MEMMQRVVRVRKPPAQPRIEKECGRPRTPAPTTAQVVWKAECHHEAVG